MKKYLMMGIGTSPPKREEDETTKSNGPVDVVRELVEQKRYQRGMQQLRKQRSQNLRTPEGRGKFKRETGKRVLTLQTKPHGGKERYTPLMRKLAGEFKQGARPPIGPVKKPLSLGTGLKPPTIRDPRKSLSVFKSCKGACPPDCPHAENNKAAIEKSRRLQLEYLQRTVWN